MRTTPGTTSSTRTGRSPFASGLAVLCLALPLTGVLGGVAAASNGNGNGQSAVGAAASAGNGKSATAGDNGRPAASAGTPFIGPVATATPTPTPYTNAGGVTTGANTTSYETVADAHGSTFTGVGGGRPSGDIHSPQPFSGADSNNTGANDTSASNPYRSTRDGSPSLNGNGGGQQVGQPCAGCVGRADNKNPPGQAPNATDANAGYECDRNHGIGRSNPAHTACTATSSPSPSPSVSPPSSPTVCPGTTIPMPANGTCGNAGNDQVTLCHATGSSTNPFVVITVSVNSVVGGHGHGDHDGDVIPAFTYDNGTKHYPGKNAGTSCSLPGPDLCPGTTIPMPVGGLAQCSPPQPGLISCPAGTTMVNGSCTAPVVTVCPAGTTMVNGSCSPPVATVCPAGTRMLPNGTCLSPPSGGTTGGGSAPGVTVPITTPLNRPVVGEGTNPVVVPTGPVPATRPTALPFTGTDAGRLLELGSVLFLLGVALVAGTRARKNV